MSPERLNSLGRDGSLSANGWRSRASPRSHGKSRLRRRSPPTSRRTSCIREKRGRSGGGSADGCGSGESCSERCGAGVNRTRTTERSEEREAAEADGRERGSRGRGSQPGLLRVRLHGELDRVGVADGPKVL
jgi:hypothetical protein